ncbi:MAG: transporter substrate-binding domain-containing protein [Christensenellaceae bacterium]|jgi:ABC-type amino acid transport substrate-binding protein|nr:transporter substrate-binding domain-containing protein [Christensenellaceae bacterium]
MAKIIKVGADYFPPYQYFNDAGKPDGIDYQKVKAVLETMGYEMDILIADDWGEVQRRFDSLALDVAFQMQPTPERLEKYYFSDLLREAVTEVVTSHSQLQITCYRDIEDQKLKLGVLQGYTNGPDIDALCAECKLEYANSAELLEGIGTAQVDLGVMDQGVKRYLMQKNGVENIYAIDALAFSRPLHVIFNDWALRDSFNRAMAKLLTSDGVE